MPLHTSGLTILTGVEYGMGRHTVLAPSLPIGREHISRCESETSSNVVTVCHISNIFFPQLVYAFEPLYITTAGIIKISVLLMYHRIFPVRYVKIGGLILAAITFAWVISIDLLAIFQCTPIAKAYDRTLPGHCISLKGALIGNGVPSFVTDIFILALPSKLIWGLQASLWQRISVIAVFLTGSLYVPPKASSSSSATYALKPY